MTNDYPEPDLNTDLGPDDVQIDYKAYRSDGNTHLAVTTDPEEISADEWEYHRMLADVLSGELPPTEPFADDIHLEPMFSRLYAPGETLDIEAVGKRAGGELTDRLQRARDEVMCALFGDDYEDVLEDTPIDAESLIDELESGGDPIDDFENENDNVNDYSTDDSRSRHGKPYTVDQPGDEDEGDR